jgi:hypothetical protein
MTRVEWGYSSCKLLHYYENCGALLLYQVAHQYTICTGGCSIRSIARSSSLNRRSSW